MKFFKPRIMGFSKTRQLIYTLLTMGALLAIVIISLFFGAEKIHFENLFLATVEKSIEHIIVFDIRLPRILLSALCGMLLGGSGAVFQGFFRNPLADSGLVGISSGATLGAVLSIFLPLSILSSSVLSPIVIFAFIGALCSAILVYILSYKLSGSNGTVMMLLIGTSLSALLSAIISILLLLRYQELHQVYVWTLGSFNGRGWDEIALISFPSLCAIVLLFFCIRPLDVLSAGEQSAQSLGVDIKKTRLLILIAGSLACACAVSVAGTIGFVGLIAPHIARKLYGNAHRNVVFFAMLWGAIILVASDTLARTIASPTELPVGIVTAMLGAPFFIVIIQKRRGLFNG